MDKNGHPEHEWIAACQKGDMDALNRLIERYRRPLYAFICTMKKNPSDIEDIFQEVWLRAIKNMKSFQNNNFSGWLFSVARNLVIDRVRREGKFHPSPDDAAPNPGSSHVDRLFSYEAMPDRQLNSKDLGERIQQALVQLSEEQREVFLMRTEANVSFKEIAVLQNTSVNTVISRMHYAIKKLRPLLRADYESLTGGLGHE